MKISIPKKPILAAAAFAAALCFGSPASQAGQIGNDKWCAVSEDGADAMTWDCEYDTVDDCSPAILGGNRGFCALNPYWRPPEPAAAAAPQR